MLELIIFAGLAAIVLYQLYAVLGRRVGRQPEDAPSVPATATPLDRASETGQQAEAAEGIALSGLAAVKGIDSSFDISRFLGGAKSAYEMIVKAFAAGDRAQLRSLLAAPVMAGFDTAIAAREAESRTETVEFLHTPRADLEKAEVVGADLARVTVRFLAEFRSRTKGPEGEGVDDRRTAENWTFQRPLSSRDPNWTLVRVEAAEA
ncbi:TIM44-related membrane protein TimA [Phenylobacterium sp.]|uniref:TIM44-related membrane protein TimA n=1 Tax=Phenylobacterium sp. TaxID=1871053 RepID=UPI002E35170F|nr:TIM44-related membrane protein TimA [Phenylobacterium sp.]HEX3366266.1 TIM44-related membrane protein TimA [Phenylobacterium sp.]